MGTLFIVATPIGNLKDISYRAIETLSLVDYILAEDTRVTGKLLNEYQLKSKMISLNDFNEPIRINSVVSDLISGKNIALVSDAGTPLISDPGYKLVRKVVKENMKIESIPGPSSPIVALTLSALPPDKFIFIGYLPKKDGKSQNILLNLQKSNLKSTVILFESPYRTVKTLNNIMTIFGDIEIVICRELTKLHEEIKRDKISIILEEQNSFRGEIIILFSLKID